MTPTDPQGPPQFLTGVPKGVETGIGRVWKRTENVHKKGVGKQVAQKLLSLFGLGVEETLRDEPAGHPTHTAFWTGVKGRDPVAGHDGTRL